MFSVVVTMQLVGYVSAFIAIVVMQNIRNNVYRRANRICIIRKEIVLSIV